MNYPEWVRETLLAELLSLFSRLLKKASCLFQTRTANTVIFTVIGISTAFEVSKETKTFQKQLPYSHYEYARADSKNFVTEKN
jgi:hypothetical protein